MPDQLTITEVAELAGVKRTSISVYRVRGTIPPPDGMTVRSPWWHRATIDRWLAERPHRGRPAKSVTP